MNASNSDYWVPSSILVSGARALFENVSIRAFVHGDIHKVYVRVLIWRLCVIASQLAS